MNNHEREDGIGLRGGARAPRFSRAARLAGQLVLVALPALAIAAPAADKGSKPTDGLPTYALDTTGLAAPPGAGKDDPSLTLLVGGKIHVVLRPATPVKDAVTVAPFWMRGNDARPWSLKSEASREGVIDLRGTVDNPFPGDIEADLVIVVARPAGKAVTPTECRPPACQQVRRRVQFVLPIAPGEPKK